MIYMVVSNQVRQEHLPVKVAYSQLRMWTRRGPRACVFRKEYGYIFSDVLHQSVSG